MVSRPEFFWMFLILVPVLIVMIRRFVRGRQDLVKIAGKWRPDSFYDLYTVKSFFSFLGTLLFIVFAILSLVGFPGNELPVSYEPAGADLIFVVDTSRSMNARDAAPSRLKTAERIIRSVCENTPGGRFGIVVFKGAGIKMIPSTEDVESVYNFLDYLNTDLLTTPGSNIAGGVETALGSFPEAEEREKYIILLTDGEIHEGDLIALAGEVVDAEATVYAVGIGTAEGAEIPLSEGGVLTDAMGKPVITQLHEEGLVSLAESTGGRYFSSADGSLLPELLSIAAGTSDDSTSRYRIVVKENYRIFLVIALLGLLLSRAVKVVRWKNDF